MDKEFEKKLLELEARQIDTEETVLRMEEWIAKALLAPGRPGFKTAIAATLDAIEKEQSKLVKEKTRVLTALAKLNNEATE